MKTQLSFLFITILLIFSCGKNDIEVSSPNKGQNAILTKSIKGTDCSQLDTSYFVKISDIEAYTKFRVLLANGEGRFLSVQDIRAIGPEEDVILCYLINYDEGWEVVAADRRAPVVLAMQESGNLNLNECESDMALQDVVSWVGYLASDVLILRQKAEYEPANEEDRKGMEASLSFWAAILDPDFEPEYRESSTKGMKYIPEGHWELTSTHVEYVDYDEVDYCSTSWSQGSPYNIYAPYKTDGSNQHAYAGCTAVAGAQMLYCLYLKHGSPSTIPTSASISGYINNYSLSFGNYSSSGWTSIANGNTSAVAVLLAYLGNLLPNHWENDGTGAYFTDLRDNVFSLFDYNCVVSSYVSSTVLAAMQQLQLPVVMSAHDDVFYILGIPIFWRSTGHSFLIDRYKRMQTKTTYVYEWVYDVLPPGGIAPIVDPRIEEVYGSPYVSNYIGMNWGWGAYYNNTWYAADGNWNAGGYDFDYERKMMTGFYYNHLP